MGSTEGDITDDGRGYGWFEGVFVPTLLTILGVILFLRTGWVVGNAGLGGAIAIIVLGFAITGTTAVSIAAIATDKSIGGGGAYAIIVRSFGIEAGGAVGIPLYLSQTLVIALYLFGFRDGWLRIFPDHPALLVDLIGFAVIVGVAVISAQFSFRVQYLILALIVVAVASMVLGAVSNDLGAQPIWWGDYPGAVDDGFAGTDFWGVFAVFFPATTGIMAGANMSGELADPRRAIPRGTLLAVTVSLVVYLGAAVWLATSATRSELLGDYTVMVEAAAWGPAILAGLLGATFSSALASMVGASRILQALAAHHVVPRSGWLAARAGDGEPRNALAVTAGIALGAVALRELNAVAPVITLFFLITYGTINLVVLAEQGLDLTSFRPRLRPPMAVPALGFLGCLIAMVVVNPTFTALALVIVTGIAAVLAHRRLDTSVSDARGALFQRLSRWAAERAKSARLSAERSWRPNLLVPTRDSASLANVNSFVRDITRPRGSVKLVGYGGRIDGERLATLARDLRGDGVATSWSIVEADTMRDAVTIGVESRHPVAAPNIVMVQFPGSERELRETRDALVAALDRDLGVLVVSHMHPGRVGARGVVNLWVRFRSAGIGDFDVGDHSNLAILLALKLERNWGGGPLNLVTVAEHDEDRTAADSYLHGLIDAARLPGPPTVHVLRGAFLDALERCPAADVNVFALSPEPDPRRLKAMIERLGTMCLFVGDAGVEDAIS